MKTPPFSIFNAAVLNHLLNQQPWTRDQLCQLAGKIICLRVPPLSLHLLIESNGAFAALRESEENAPDATLTLAAAAAARFALTRQLDVAEICIQGDYETGSAVGRVLRSLKWDAEEDMSRLVGDIAAHKIMQFGADALAETRRQAISLGSMLVEYWQEENPLIAKRRHLEDFAARVDVLRNAAERLAKRIEKLEQAR